MILLLLLIRYAADTRCLQAWLTIFQQGVHVMRLFVTEKMSSVIYPEVKFVYRFEFQARPLRHIDEEAS